MLIQDWILCFLFIAAVLLLLFTCKWNVAKHNNRWRILYLVPTVICIIHLLVAGVEWCLSGIYIGAFVATIGYFLTTVAMRRKSSIVAIALCIFTIPFCFFSDSYRTACYVADFEEGFTTMKEYYSLSHHKNIDWDALYEKYYPLFEQAEETQDENANITAWFQFCNEFYDCHTFYVPKGDYEEKVQSATESVVGNDYGLSMVQLSTGEYAAVAVAENSQAFQAGIHTGTIITQWDGKDIKELLPTAVERMKQCTIVENIENQNFYQSLFVPGFGGDQVQVTFFNDEGKEELVTLDAMGNYYQRLKDTTDCLTYKTPRENMSVVSLNEDTILLNVNMMAYDSATTESANYNQMQAKIREQLVEYRQKGASNLIIDLRQNGGGSSMMARSIVSLVADKEIFWAADGTYNAEAKDYEILNTYTCSGENLWAGGEIVVLVNSRSSSAANHLMAGIQKLNNVTVMGISEPAGAAQGVTEIPLTHGSLSFSTTLVLDENEEIWIDGDESGHCRLVVDKKIPLTQETLVKMFEEERDYVLDYGLKWFEEN
ncbi:MAG: hypothetical protein IJA36_03470 [Lachnospiraceae bacterium]|nr:hypothetical protein [Lachnospiraceae bacterium]